MDMEKVKTLNVNEWKRLAGTELGAIMIKNAMRFDFDRTNCPETNSKNWNKISDWCNENFNGLYHLLSTIESNTIYVEFEEDAVAFKLGWVG